MSTHTPGPDVLAQMQYVAGDAALIAAAPDLLAELKRLEARFADLHDRNCNGVWLHDLEHVRAAIARAEGKE